MNQDFNLGKKVGIVSCYFKNNYGSMLQAYATKKILDNNKIPNETINIDNNIDFKKGKRKYYITQISNFNFIKAKFGMIKLKLDKKIVKNLGKKITIRDNKYKEFRKEFNLSKPCTNYRELNILAKNNYSDVIVGSDQLWLPVNVVADYYTLNWVPNEINKVSYSTSIGVNTIPKKYNEKYKNFLQKINHLSVREDSGVRLIKEIANINAELVCDPTILLKKEEWEEEATKETIIQDKYILCYFLGNNIEHRKFAEKLKKETGCKIVSLNHADEYVKYSDEFADITPYDIGPREWINLIKNAEYVCTDSFHGTVFSLIFNRTFFAFRRHNSKSKASTNSRLDSLLKIAGVSNERILNGKEDIEKVLAYKIDYTKVNENLSKYRNKSKEWLLSAINYKAEQAENKYIEIKNKELCTGCTACKNICPKNAIEMIRDEEGFLYPCVDKSKCINCGLCKRVCPVINKKIREQFKQKGYIFQNKNEEVRRQSTSGGAFSAIADYVLENDGVVFGVGFNKDYKVEHQIATKKSELEKFRNSKYVQSDPNSTFKDVKNYLEQNKLVCYSGTACQIEGLKSYLGKDYENLLTVDVICRAVPSPLLWEKYLEFKNKNNDVEKVYFRDKYYGYKYSNLTMYDKNGIVYKNGVDTDPYLRAFFSNIACRPSCYNCHFKEQLHKADITIWDCFNVEKFEPLFDDDKGTTRVLLNSEKAIRIFDRIKDKHNVKEVDTDKLVSNFHQMFYSVKYNDKREEFFEDLNNLPFEKVMIKYFPNSVKCKVEKYGRITLIKTGLYKKIIKLGRIFRKRN